MDKVTKLFKKLAEISTGTATAVGATAGGLSGLYQSRALKDSVGTAAAKLSGKRKIIGVGILAGGIAGALTNKALQKIKNS